MNYKCKQVKVSQCEGQGRGQNPKSGIAQSIYSKLGSNSTRN